MSKSEDDLELTVKESLLLKSLIVFYEKRDNLNVLLQFLKSKQRRLSLRLLDWLVTNYAKNHPIMIQYKSNTAINSEFMYLSYKNHLKSFSKKFFDVSLIMRFNIWKKSREIWFVLILRTPRIITFEIKKIRIFKHALLTVFK